ncbi:tRNA guanosine(34) transglycosylase Tgt [bacterium]|nr:tRNA guanosine(34) transglycosylase Tgt [bacterium]
MFKLLKTSQKSQARLGVLTTARGKVSTPFFMPIATKAALKSLTANEVKNLGAEIILSNTYHNYLRPGMEVIKKHGNLHQFMDCDLPILTDSGGYQVFSLSNLRKIDGDNIAFRSHIDGSKHVLNPKKVVDIQVALNSDIMMVLDECIGLPAKRQDAIKALDRTTRWAEMAFNYKQKLNKKSVKIKKQLIFGIVQGADFEDLRKRSADELMQFDWDGLAIGGLAVGESNDVMYKVLDYTTPVLPADKPRYLMGVGYPDNIIEAVKRGLDMFDCVIPTREARHGRLYLWKGKPSVTKKDFYKTINITNAKFAKDKTLLAEGKFGKYSLSYLHHLFKTQEPLALRLATLNNLKFYLDLMLEIRKAIKNNKL